MRFPAATRPFDVHVSGLAEEPTGVDMPDDATGSLDFDIDGPGAERQVVERIGT